MQDSYTYASENDAVKKYLLTHYLERVFPMAKKMTRKQQLENLKLLTGRDLLRSYNIVLNRYDPDDSQSVWEFNAVKEEMLNRMSY